MQTAEGGVGGAAGGKWLGLTRALYCLRPLAGGYGCGRRGTTAEGRSRGGRPGGRKGSRENQLGSAATRTRTVATDAEAGRRSSGRRRAAGHAASCAQARQSRRGWRRGEGDAQVREDSRAPRFVLARSMPEPTRNRTDDIAYCPDPTVSGLTGDVGPILSPRNNPGFDIKRLLIGSCFLFFYAVGS